MTRYPLTEDSPLAESFSIPCAFNSLRGALMSRSSAKSILTISRDTQLQHLRTLILENSGYHVAAATSDAEAISFLEKPNSFILALLCHSVPEESRVYLAARIKELSPQLPILMLYNGYDPTKAKVDGSLHNLDSPEVWLQMIDFLTRGRSQNRLPSPAA